MAEIKVTKVSQPGILPDADKLGFGTIFTDHMFSMDYSNGQGWHNPQIVPYEEINLSPAASTLHYGQAIFEGMKAFRQEDKVVLFRTQDHLNRLNNSADILCIPRVDVALVRQYLHELIKLDQRWVPQKTGTSLYVRPFIFAADPYLGVKVADTYKLFILLSPVGAYYAEGFNPVKIMVEEKYVRAAVGGLGEAKTPANYAASLRAQHEAHEKGYSQSLWLDAVERRYIEEVGSMNIFFKINGELVTPALVGSILDGITRKTVLQVAKEWGIPVAERRITVDEIFEAHAKGQLEEVFGSGTAAVISPVGELAWKGQQIIINGNQTGPLAQKLFDHITGIQYGRVNDTHGWVDEVVRP